MPEPVIQVTNLQKIYRSGIFGRRKLAALQDVSLQIEPGRIYGLLGPNGAGKTTLIKVLLGIVRKTGGEATVLGQPAGSLETRRRIGYLPENNRIPRHLTGQTALEYYGCLNGLALAEVRRRIPGYLDKVGLAGREKDRVGGYSKGMQQRLGLAQAMIHNPELIILDEPTDGVDPVGRKEIREVLKQFASDGCSIFLNSHLLQEIELICEHVTILTKGVVRKSSTVKELTEVIGDSPIIFRIAATAEEARPCFEGMNVRKVIQVDEGVLEIDGMINAQPDVDKVVDNLRSEGLSIISMTRRAMTLEEAFLEIVKESN